MVSNKIALISTTSNLRFCKPRVNKSYSAQDSASFEHPSRFQLDHTIQHKKDDSAGSYVEVEHKTIYTQSIPIPSKFRWAGMGQPPAFLTFSVNGHLDLHTQLAAHRAQKIYPGSKRHAAF